MELFVGMEIYENEGFLQNRLKYLTNTDILELVKTIKKGMPEMNETVSATEFKTNMGRYLKQIQLDNTQIDITKNGRVVATVSTPKKEDKLAKLLALRGIIPDEGQTKESIRTERIQKRHEDSI